MGTQQNKKIVLNSRFALPIGYDHATPSGTIYYAAITEGDSVRCHRNFGPAGILIKTILLENLSTPDLEGWSTYGIVVWCSLS